MTPFSVSASRRLVAIAVATSLAWVALRDARASWPPDTNADLTDPANWPSDPGYASLWGYISYLPAQTTGTAAYQTPDLALGAAGMSIDKAWEYSVGSPAVKIAILDSGIEWDAPDLLQRVWLNPAELSGAHMPRSANGTACAGTANGGLVGYDCNGDGIFTVADYANDPRISPVVPGSTCEDPATNLEQTGRMLGDVNHNCALDAGDLIALFSDGVDDDANGYVDDIAGWDFFKNDNDPYDDLRNGHGTTEAKEANAEGNNAIDTVGACPSCRFMMLRVGDSAVVDSNDFAKAVVYAADNVAGGGASVVEESLGAVNLTGFARAAIDYAYSKDVVVVASMADENSRHHNLPSTYGHSLTVHGLGYDGTTAASSTTFLQYVDCNNYGGQLALSASGLGCSDEAAGRTAGVAGLIFSYALSLGPPLALTAEEVIQLEKMNADVIDVPASRAGATAAHYYESLPGFSQRFGYGRLNAATAMQAVKDGRIPPEVDISSPNWFETLYSNRVESPVPLVGRVVATRASSYDFTVEWAAGVEPLDADFKPLVAPVTNVPGQTVTGGPSTPLALLDPDGFDTAHAADPDSPHHENDRTITVRVRAVAHYSSGDAKGEARRSFAIVNERNGLDADLLPGFPLRLSGSVEGGAKLVDISGDGVRDIVIASNDGLLHVLSMGGSAPTEVGGFPYALAPLDGLDPTAPVPTVPSYLTAPAYTAGKNGGIAATLTRESVDGSPAIGDVDGDGAPDIVFASWAGTLYVVSHTGLNETGWPKRLPLVPSCPLDPSVSAPPGDCMNVTHDLARGAFASPVLADMDGDGRLDIVLAAFDGNVYVFHGDGTAVSGFPVRVHSPDAFRYDRIMGTPAVADFDKDGIPDILVGSNETIGSAGDVGFYFIVSGSGMNAPGGPFLSHWPVRIPSTYLSAVVADGTSASPVALDLAADGKLDALLQGNGSAPLLVPADPGPQMGSAAPPSRLPIQADGTSGFAPLDKFGDLSGAMPDEMLPLYSHPSVGDLDQDGTPDVVMTGAGRSLDANLASKTPSPFQQLLGMWSGKTGQMMRGSPVVLEDDSFLTSQAIADITGDGYPEVIAGTGGYFVHAVDACGHEADGWPKYTGGWVSSTPAVGDIDGDLGLEVVTATREGSLYAWSTKGKSTGVVQWESFHHDNANSGNYGAALDQGVLLAAGTPIDCANDTGGATSTTTTSASGRSTSGSGGCDCSVAAGDAPRKGGAWALATTALLGLVLTRRRRRDSSVRY